MPTLSIIRRQAIRAARKVARSMGVEISRAQGDTDSNTRPVGSMTSFLEDLKTRGFEPRSILDVGANVGDWSRSASEFFPNASYLLIEPHQELAAHLELFCRDFPKLRRFVTAGAGAEAGELTLTYSNSHDWAESSFLPTENTSLAPGLSQRKVEIVTIDSLYNDDALLPDLVKLDIQGFELEALKGAQKLFGRTDMFILEVSLYEFGPKQPIFSEVIAFMAAKGYEAYDLPGFMRRPLDGALGQADVAFARRNSPLRASNKW